MIGEHVSVKHGDETLDLTIRKITKKAVIFEYNGTRIIAPTRWENAKRGNATTVSEAFCANY